MEPSRSGGADGASSWGSHGEEISETILAVTTFLADHAALYTSTDSDPSRLALAGRRGDPRPAGPAPAGGTSLPQRALVSGQIEPSPLPEATNAIALPMTLADDTVAVLYLERKGEVPFSPGDLAAAQALTTVAGLLVRLEQIHMASQELTLQEERNRIAREIHDGVSQNLALLLLKMEIVSRLADSDPARMRLELGKVMSILEDSVQGLRRSIDTLRLPA